MFDSNQKNCPECKAQWKNDITITQYFKNAKENENHEQHNFYKHKTDEQILQVGKSYGCTPENPKYFSNENLVGIEHSNLYDGVLMWLCTKCKTQWGRFSGTKNIDPKEEMKIKWEK